MKLLRQISQQTRGSLNQKEEVLFSFENYKKDEEKKEKRLYWGGIAMLIFIILFSIFLVITDTTIHYGDNCYGIGRATICD